MHFVYPDGSPVWARVLWLVLPPVAVACGSSGRGELFVVREDVRPPESGCLPSSGGARSASGACSGGPDASASTGGASSAAGGREGGRGSGGEGERDSDAAVGSGGTIA